MTRNDVLERVKRDRPGESTDAELNLWLDQLDMRWKDEVLETHWDPAGYEFAVKAKGIMETEEKTWKCADGSATAGGLTIKWQGNLLMISGTSTATVNIRLNGATLAAETGTAPSSWTTGITGPGASGYKVFYVMPEGNDAGVAMGFLPSDQELEEEYVSLTDAGTVDTTGDEQMSNACIFLQVSSGVTFPKNWVIWTMIPKTATDWPDDWDDLVKRAVKEQLRGLLIPEIDEETYIYWLYSKIDYRLGEMARYNNDAQMYNYAWDAACKRWHRHHLPKGRQVIHNIYGHPFPWPVVEDPLNQRMDWFRF